AFTAEEYVREATRWARAIRMLDPRAKLVSCGMNGWNEWDRVVIEGMSSLADYHSLHIYTGSDDYWTNVLQPPQAERAIRSSQAALEMAVDVSGNGPVVSPELPAGAGGWPLRVGDLGPFCLIDAAATVSGADVNAHSVAVTLVNRSPEEELAEVLLRDCAF